MALVQLILCINYFFFLIRLPVRVDGHSRFSIGVELFSLESHTI